MVSGCPCRCSCRVSETGNRTPPELFGEGRPRRCGLWSAVDSACRTRRRDCAGEPGRPRCAAARPSSRRASAPTTARRSGSPGCRPTTWPTSSGNASGRPSAGCGTTPPGGTRRCWRPASGSSAAPTCGSATPSSGGRRSSTRPCSPPTRPPGWDALQPVTADRRPRCSRSTTPPTGSIRWPSTSGSRRPSPPRAEQGRLGLLLAAESSGALVAAEMTHAGLPWRADVHERLLTELLGPRPAPGQRPAVLEALLAEIRAAFGRPAQPRLTRRAAAGAPGRGAAGERHALLDARAARPPRHPGAARVQEARAAAPGQRLGLAGHLGARRAVPVVLPARRCGHRAVGVQRRRRALGAHPGAARRRSPTRAGGSSSPTSPSSSRACSRG